MFIKWLCCNKQQIMNIRHIAIPFDELELFKEQEKYQNYLVETLIYSTKVTIHRDNSKNKYIFVFTKRNLWAEEENKTKNKLSIPLSCILAVIKCEDHPELVLVTEQNYDNLRISANNEDRCHHIISAIAFYFTYLAPLKKPLKVYLIKQNSLLYFQRTSKEKRSGPKINLERYASQDIAYVESTDSPDIFGKLLIQKMQLAKLINSEDSHLVHVAKVNEAEEYICHTIDKTAALIGAIKHHKNLDFVCKLLYARTLQYKLQLFFEPMQSLKPQTMAITCIFEQILLLYEKVMEIDCDLYLSPYMLCLQNEDSSRLFLRQFRYRQLRFDDDYQRFLFKKIINPRSKQESFINKMYNMGMLLYYFLFGRCLFEHDDLEVSIHLKQTAKQVPFPYHTKAVYSKKARLFIECCILGRFEHKQMVMEHPWIKEVQIKL